jgi:hypothetical protein
MGKKVLISNEQHAAMKIVQDLIDQAIGQNYDNYMKAERGSKLERQFRDLDSSLCACRDIAR